MTSSMSPELRAWRYRVFAATWLSYVGYYFCRQPFYVAKATLGKTYRWDAAQLGLLGTFYLFSYMVGQFAAGWTGNRTGARVLLLGGMAVSACANFAFGLTTSFVIPVGNCIIFLVTSKQFRCKWPHTNCWVIRKELERRNELYDKRKV